MIVDNRFSGLIVTAAVAAAAGAAISVSVTQTSAQAPPVSGAVVKTPPLKRLGENLIYRESGPTNLTRPCSAPPREPGVFHRCATR